MATLLFVLALLIAALLLSVGMITPQTWLFGVGSVLLALVFILSLNPGPRDDQPTHAGH